MSRRYYTYILTNKNNTTLYIGVTGNLEQRILQHKKGICDGFTRKYNLHKLIYAEYFGSAFRAIEREKQIKGWSRSKKVELINKQNPEWKELEY